MTSFILDNSIIYPFYKLYSLEVHVERAIYVIGQVLLLGVLNSILHKQEIHQGGLSPDSLVLYH